MANFTSFIGGSAVCNNGCTSGGLAPQGGADGASWSLSNITPSEQHINGGQSGLPIEGSYPFSNRLHPGGCNMGFCDGGVRFVKNTLDGIVYSKIITPQGSKLPLFARQLPVSQDAFAQ